MRYAQAQRLNVDPQAPAHFTDNKLFETVNDTWTTITSHRYQQISGGGLGYVVLYIHNKNFIAGC